MSVHDYTAGAMHLDSTARAFHMANEMIRAEFPDYPSIRRAGSEFGDLQRIFQTAAGEYQAQNYPEVLRHLTSVAAHPFLLEQQRQPVNPWASFSGFLEALNSVLKAIRDVDALLMDSYLGRMYMELSVSLPAYLHTLPKFGSN